ncbi:MAG: ROK family protein [Candidatus Omnitrophota bacterium]|nr:ROK family protein [Candidatus Omnitrophota bacterium]
MIRIGVDLGGTKIEAVALDEQGKVLCRERISTEQEGGYRHILNRVKQLVATFSELCSAEEFTLGIGTPGAVSYETGFLKNSNTACLNKKPFKKDLQEILKRDFSVENDANCFAMAEAAYGAGRGKDMVFGVIMGTGCGGGIVYRGKLWQGLQAIAGEWGHMSIDPKGPECYCGQRGCVETFVSGGGLQRLYLKEFGQVRCLEDIVSDYRKGVVESTQFMKAFFENFGRAMANLISVLDPDIIVMGGGVSNIDEIYSLGVAAVERKIFSDRLRTPIVKHALGDSAGVLGAALIGI